MLRTVYVRTYLTAICLFNPWTLLASILQPLEIELCVNCDAQPGKHDSDFSMMRQGYKWFSDYMYSKDSISGRPWWGQKCVSYSIFPLLDKRESSRLDFTGCENNSLPRRINIDSHACLSCCYEAFISLWAVLKDFWGVRGVSPQTTAWTALSGTESFISLLTSSIS